ncbi:hypothetical protein P3W45_000338 [Vairimorpha bombi]
MIDELEAQFRFQEYVLSDRIEGYIFNFMHVTKEDDSAFGKIYFVTKDLKNYFIKIPYFYALTIECTNIGDVEEYIKNQYSEGFFSSKIVEKYDCKEFNHLNKPKKQFLQIFMKYQNVFNRLVKDIKRIVYRNRNDRNIDSVYKDMTDKVEYDQIDVKSQILDVHEYDIPYEISLANTYNMRAGSWHIFSYNGEEYTIEKSDLIGMPEFRVFAFDIETMKKPLRFPDSRYDQIMMISIKTESSNILITNRSVVSEDIGTFEYSPKDDMQSIFTIFNMKNEEELLLKFAETVQKHKTHIVTTYNGNFFDFPYIEARMDIYNLSMRELIGFSLEKDYYSCPFILHLDCYKWVVRDSYLPMGSQGLKAVTKAKLGYFPDEIDPEEMVETAVKNPLKMAAYSVSDAVATYFLFIKYVQPHVFSLSSILPYPPVKILCTGSGSLCEALLIIEAYNYALLIPKEKRKDFLEIYNGRVIENMTYVGGYVESLKSGIFRSDFNHIFNIKNEGILDIINSIDDVLINFQNEDDIYEIKENIKKALLSFSEKIYSTGNIYHLDVSAMYPNIILTNRLQPTSIVNDDICVRCDFSTKESKCKRRLNWEAKIDYYVPTVNEIREIRQNVITDHDNNLFKIKTNSDDCDTKFEDLNQAKQDALVKKKILDYSRQIYKKQKTSTVEKRDATVCQREIPFYVDSVRKFRDQRYIYKKKLRDLTNLYNTCEDTEKKKEYKKEMVVYSSLQVAHKCILNSFYGYVMRKGARWHSTEMAAIVCNIGAQIIKSCKSVIESFSMPLELDTDGIWTLVPSSFPIEINFKSGKKINFLNSYINHKVCQAFTNDQYQENIGNEYVIKPNNSIEFELDGPYKGMVIPSALEEGKQLKKRYIVLNWDNSIAEFKGFELKRRGELEIIKRLQEELFECFSEGTNLTECYDKLSQVCKYWLDLIHNKGKSLDDDDIFDLFSEFKSMSKDISEYNAKASSILSTARKMAELLGEDILSEKLKVEFIVSAYPEDEPVSNRTIPTIVFKSSEREYYIKKWCKLNKMMDIRELLDWNYYLKRVEDIIVKIICLPAMNQNIKNPISSIKAPDWTSKFTTKYDLLDFVKKTKVETPKIPIVEKIKVESSEDKMWAFYNKKKNRNGVVNCKIEANNALLTMYNNDQIVVPLNKTFYFIADTKYFIKHKFSKIEKFLPSGDIPGNLGKIILPYSEYPSVLDNSLVSVIYHKDVPVLFENKFGDNTISKYPDYTILSTFNYSKSIIYVFSKNEEYFFVSDIDHPKIMKGKIKDFLLEKVNNLIVLNKFDKNLDILKNVCSDYVIILDEVRIKKKLSTFNELLEINKMLHKDINKKICDKLDLSAYTGVPIGNVDIDYTSLLDYLYYKLITKSQGLVFPSGPESIRIFNIEKYFPGYYKAYTIQFECLGSLILSILEYESILDDPIGFSEVNRLDFKIIHQMIKNIFYDHSKNVKGASLLLNRLEKWLRIHSQFISTELKDLINLLHQRFLFKIVAELRKLEINVIYVSSNIFCISSDKYTREGSDEIFDYVCRKISEVDGYAFLVCKKLRVFEKLLLINPSTYFYKKDSDYFCVSDIKVPVEYIKKYFAEDLLDSKYIYDLITKVDIEVSELMIDSLEIRSDVSDSTVSNCKKLLNIDEYTKKEKESEMLIICRCGVENIMRTRCIKCLYKFTREEVNEVVKKYFNIIINLELGDDTYCDKCMAMNEKKLSINCKCGGFYKKKSYKKNIEDLLRKCRSERMKEEYVKILEFYKLI